MISESISGMERAGLNYSVVMPGGPVEEGYWTWTVPDSSLETK